MRKLCVVAVVLSACGMGLDEGEYDVTLTPVSDSCGGAEASTALWRISEADGEWTLTNTRNNFTATGSESDGEFFFTTTAYTTLTTGCRVRAEFEITLEPDGDGFTGEIVADATAECDGSTCRIVTSVVGERAD